MTAFTARRKIDQAMLGVLAVVVTVLSSCGEAKPVAAPTTTQAPLPSPAQQNATHQVKIDYRRLIVHAAEGFARATIALNAALDHNNHAEAVKQWAIAQGDFDAYGRNNINPKTGEFVAFNYDKNNFSSF